MRPKNTKICSVPGCGRLTRSRGWCVSHYRRWQRHGDPLAGNTYRGALQKWLHENAGHSGDDCLLWPFGRNTHGYGAVTALGHGAHHSMCEMAHGPRPTPQHEAAHQCGNRLCCNPQHLRWATPKENAADMLLHGTRLIGECHPLAKLTAAQVLEIRAIGRSEQRKILAAQYGVHNALIHRILRGTAWKHVVANAPVVAAAETEDA